MKRTQIWCDQCGRIIKDHRVEHGDGVTDIDTTDESWEIWTREIDLLLFCSLDCLIAGANNLATTQAIKDANEDN